MYMCQVNAVATLSECVYFYKELIVMYVCSN